MSTKVKSPTSAELKSVLGSADVVWFDIFRVVEEIVAPLNTEWKRSKTEFGRMCLLQHKKRTLLYLTPEKEGDGGDYSWRTRLRPCYDEFASPCD